MRCYERKFNFSKCKSDCVITSRNPCCKPANSYTFLITATGTVNFSLAPSTTQTSACITLALLHFPGMLGFIQFFKFPCSLPLLGLSTASSSLWGPFCIVSTLQWFADFVLCLQSSAQAFLPLVAQFCHSLLFISKHISSKAHSQSAFISALA